MTDMIINWGSAADMCDCPDLPVNEWLDVAGETIRTRTIAADTGESDANEYLADPAAIGWRIVCPTCRKVYAIGGTRT